MGTRSFYFSNMNTQDLAKALAWLEKMKRYECNGGVDGNPLSLLIGVGGVVQVFTVCAANHFPGQCELKYGHPAVANTRHNVVDYTLPMKRCRSRE